MPVLALLLQSMFHACNCMPDMLHSKPHVPLIVIMAHRASLSVKGLPVMCATLNMHTAQITGCCCIMCMHVTPERAASGLQGCRTGRHTAMMCKVRACHRKAGPLRPDLGIQTGEHGCYQMPHSLTSARLHQPAQICTIMLTMHSLNAPGTLVNRQMMPRAAQLVVDICRKQQSRKLLSIPLRAFQLATCGSFKGPCMACHAVWRLIALHASCRLEIRGNWLM